MTEPIYFDARYIRLDHHDGISRFSSGLCTALSEIAEVIAIIYDKRQLDKLPPGIKYVVLNEPTKVMAEILVARKLNALGAKFVYSPMQTMGTWFRKYKLILTLHDLIYYAHPTPPRDFSPLIRLGWRLFHLTFVPQRLMLNGADAVVTVSETTKNLMKSSRLTSKPIFVVYNAGSGTPSQHKETPNHNLIYMGSFMDYKNVECLVDAMEYLPAFNLHLLSRISAKRKAELERRAGEYTDRIVFHNGISDERYQSLLSEGFALTSASRDEGFGIPVIEAMEHGTPAIVSDIAIFREIGGHAALYFNPDNPEQLAERVLQLEEPQAWQARSAAVMAQAKHFDWGNSARALLQALRTL